MCHPEPFHIFKSNIFAKAHSQVAEVTVEWLETQNARVLLYWNAGESSNTAADTIAAFAKGHFSKHRMGREKSPLQLAKLVIRF